MPFEVDSFMPTFGAPDLDAAIAFYEKIGFREAWRYPEQGETTHAGVCQGHVTLMLARQDARCPQKTYAFVSGVDELYRLCTGAVPENTSAIEDFDYGMRDFSVTDPWGNEIAFGESLERVERREP